MVAADQQQAPVGVAEVVMEAVGVGDAEAGSRVAGTQAGAPPMLGLARRRGTFAKVGAMALYDPYAKALEDQLTMGEKELVRQVRVTAAVAAEAVAAGATASG